MDEYFNSASEVAVLRRKLQSKAEALLILTQELDQCRTERDQLKLIAEQAQTRSMLKRSSDEQVYRGRLSLYHDNSVHNGSISSDHYLEIREQNKALRYEIQDLKQKLREAYGDIKVLRSGAAEGSRLMTIKEVSPAHQREELVEQLEQMGARAGQLEADLRSMLDEKEELINERETYRGKVTRLNHQLNTLLLGGPTTQVIDIDALLMDNKYLQEQLQQLQAEKELAHQALVKYKSMLEKKRNKGIVRLGNQNVTMVVSPKQVQELLERGSSSQIPNTEATLADLKGLCLALLEALQDKCLALTHQRRANKILANRVCELEQRMGTAVPSLLLLQAYSTEIDKDHFTDEFVKKREDIQKDESLDCREQPNDNSVNGCDTDTNDSLPPDLQELVTKALQEIKEEESKNK